MNELDYNEEKMKRFVEMDKYLSFVYKDLLTRNNPHSDALKIIFNSNLLEDSFIAEEYKKL